MNALVHHFKKLFTLQAFDRMLAKFTQQKDFDNFFVKLLPSNLQYKRESTRTAEVNGIRYQLYMHEWMEYVLYFGIKTENKQPLYNLVKPGMVVFDVGTNFGETLLNLAALTGASGKVYGFEPMPYIYSKCKKNISLNRFANIILENKALGDKTETLFINEPANGNSGGTFVSKMNITGTATATIDALPLDVYAQQQNIERIDLVKIDVEGFETNVIKGSLSSIEKFRPILFLEFSDDNLKRTGSSAVELVQLLHELRYNITDIGGMQIITENALQFKHTDIIARPLV